MAARTVARTDSVTPVPLLVSALGSFLCRRARDPQFVRDQCEGQTRGQVAEDSRLSHGDRRSGDVRGSSGDRLPRCLVGDDHFCRVLRDCLRGGPVGGPYCRGVLGDGLGRGLVGRRDHQTGGVQGLNGLVGGGLLHNAGVDQRSNRDSGRTGDDRL